MNNEYLFSLVKGMSSEEKAAELKSNILDDKGAFVEGAGKIIDKFLTDYESTRRSNNKTLKESLNGEGMRVMGDRYDGWISEYTGFVNPDGLKGDAFVKSALAHKVSEEGRVLRGVIEQELKGQGSLDPDDLFSKASALSDFNKRIEGTTHYLKSRQIWEGESKEKIDLLRDEYESKLKAQKKTLHAAIMQNNIKAFMADEENFPIANKDAYTKLTVKSNLSGIYKLVDQKYNITDLGDGYTEITWKAGENKGKVVVDEKGNRLSFEDVVKPEFYEYFQKPRSMTVRGAALLGGKSKQVDASKYRTEQDVINDKSITSISTRAALLQEVRDRK